MNKTSKKMNEEKLKLIINFFIKKYRNKMRIGSADLAESVQLYLYQSLITPYLKKDNFKKISDSNYSEQLLKLLQVFESDSDAPTYKDYKSMTDFNAHPWSDLLSPYANSNLIFVENENDIFSAVKLLNPFSSFKIFISTIDIDHLNIDIPEDFIFIKIIDSPIIKNDNIFMRKCFYKIFNIANSLFWILTLLKPKVIYLLNSKKSLYNSILESIANSEKFDLTVLSYE